MIPKSRFKKLPKEQQRNIVRVYMLMNFSMLLLAFGEIVYVAYKTIN